MPGSDNRTHEVTFCSRVAGWANELFHQHPEWPFERAEIEESTGASRKRSDLRFYGRKNQLILGGEVKMPGTPEGRNAFNSKLIEDSYYKASNAGAEFFFTWNVNKFVLFDSKKWHLPVLERRVKDSTWASGSTTGRMFRAPKSRNASKAFWRISSLSCAPSWKASSRNGEWRPIVFFIRAFESHVSWPVKLTAEFLWAKSAADRKFDALLQEWMAGDQGWTVIRNDPQGWRTLIDRAARTLCYVFCNRLLFYESVRRKFDELSELHVPKKVQLGGRTLHAFSKSLSKGRGSHRRLRNAVLSV